jgi:hypothetical protein
VQPPAAAPDVYAVVPSINALPQAMQVAEALRAAGVVC